MPFFELFDETLDINSTENYELSVQLSGSELTFCLLDTIRNKFILLRSSEPDDNRYFSYEALNELISRDDFLVRKYKKVNIILPSRKFTLVPSPLFDPGKKEDYFSFNLNREEDEVILSNKSSEPDAWVIFAVQKHILDVVSQFYPSAFPFHHIKPLLNQLAHFNKNAGAHYIHVHIGEDYFNLFIFENSILKFSNTFNYRNITDILYFVLNVLKGMEIKNDEIINFSGRTEKYDDIYSGFAMYLRNIRFAAPSGNFAFSYVFNEIELHRYINLFSAGSCE